MDGLCISIGIVIASFVVGGAIHSGKGAISNSLERISYNLARQTDFNLKDWDEPEPENKTTVSVVFNPPKETNP